MKVYQAISAVQGELAKIGISKDQTNTFDKYKFRGIDDVYNAMAPLLAKHGLCILPRVISRESVERESQKGGALFYITVLIEFDFVCAEDGSKHTVSAYGEAMDRGDKGTNKAMSAAFKYAAFQAFCIPTEAQDADAESHSVVGRATPMAGVAESLTDDERAMMERYAALLVAEWLDNDDPEGAVNYMAALDLTTEGKAYLWSLFDSKQRSAMKKVKA